MTDNNGDTYSYRGWMNSDSFLKRAVGVWLYALMGGFIVWLIIMLVFVILMVIAALFGAAMFGIF
jgi:hypothetical protein